MSLELTSLPDTNLYPAAHPEKKGDFLWNVIGDILTSLDMAYVVTSWQNF